MATLNELQSKYQSVLDKGGDLGMTVQNINMDGDKLLVRGVIPSEYAKNELWDAVKAVGGDGSDATFDINVQSGLTYKVKSGDTLSKIAKRFYGDANHYNQIFSVNKDQLSDPDKIQVGQELKLP